MDLSSAFGRTACWPRARRASRAADRRSRPNSNSNSARLQINLTDKPIGKGEDELPALHLRVTENRVTIGKRIETGTPTSVASRRTLPLPADAVKARRRHVGARQGSS